MHFLYALIPTSPELGRLDPAVAALADHLHYLLLS